MKQEELSLIKDQMNDLFMAHRQMSGIYKNSIIKLLSRAIDDEFIFNDVAFVISSFSFIKLILLLTKNFFNIFFFHLFVRC